MPTLAAPHTRTGALLAEILTRPEHRRRWVRRVTRHRPGASLNQRAIAEVLARHLWEEGLAPESRHDLPRQLRDRVSRALNGTVLTPFTLDCFIAAFDLDVTDADQLWASYVAELHREVRPTTSVSS